MAFDPAEHTQRVLAQYREIQGLRDVESPVESVTRDQVIRAIEALGIDPKRTTSIDIRPREIVVTRFAMDENDALVPNPYADVCTQGEPSTLIRETYAIPVHSPDGSRMSTLAQLSSAQRHAIEGQLTAAGYSLDDVHAVTIAGPPGAESIFALAGRGLDQYQAYVGPDA
ncbi:hypothetical protein SEA_EYRE_67 [Gordonia phage Eyre]|uniref:Uncharacterized protein n=1 Tax=Gordonia phage Eyre TaxID=1887646 RepID=A0A1B3B053_9CAUD|nr:hypothetical protein BIZ73_gp67 [Gordonia phage Eyre]AOE44346.1 hypothetical protein SEA_EYRE_67 [Gordonia phage Eyre]